MTGENLRLALILLAICAAGIAMGTCSKGNIDPMYGPTEMTP